jgi:K+-sensing histidine kinase KdpD
MDHSDSQMASAEVRETFFAPARRASAETLAVQVAEVVHHPVIAAVLESFCGQVLVLNRDRQILAASPEFAEALAACGMPDFVGKRPGEALGCEHATESPGGCGTSAACAHCGAVMAILAAQCCKSSAYEECWISMRRKDKRESVEFRAKATPLVLEGAELVVLALHDISDQKRRGILEQSFLHDARNLLAGIVTWSEVLQCEPSEEAVTSIRALALQLRDQFTGHALLAQAEKGDLLVNKIALDLSALARALGQAFSRHPGGEGKNFVVRFSAEAPAPVSDQGLVLRVLSNMVSNAIEASAVGTTVEVHYEVLAGAPTFAVRNPGTIPQDVAPRIFQRSFTTKTEPGHGLGTYGMRLMAEQYLGGRVAFTSSPEHGTAFTLTLPAA